MYSRAVLAYHGNIILISTVGKPDQKVTDMFKFDRRLKIHLVSHSQPLSP